MLDTDSVEITAASVEEAVLLGLTRLVLTRDEVDIEVLDEGSKGFLGLGMRPARVRLTPRTGRGPQSVEGPEAVTDASQPQLAAEVQAQVPEPVEPSHPAASIEIAESVAAPQTSVDAPPDDVPVEVEVPLDSEDEPEDQDEEGETEDEGLPAAAGELDYAAAIAVAQEVAAHLFMEMSLEVEAEWQDEDRPTLWISIQGKDANALVGPRAQTLDAIQYLFRTLVHRRIDGNYNLIVDADGYRQRRRRSVESLARQNADKAVELGRTVRLKAMPPHERRLVHMVLREDARVTTESVGRGRDRAVTIIPKK